MSLSFLGFEGTDNEKPSGGEGEATSMPWSAIVIGSGDVYSASGGVFGDDDVVESLAVYSLVFIALSLLSLS